MSRFIVSRVAKIGSGALEGFVNVQDTETGMEYRDIRLFDGSNGRFIKFFEKEYEDKDGKTKYAATLTPIWDEDEEAFSEAGKAFMDEMLAAIEIGFDAAEDESHRRKPSARGGNSSSKTTSRKPAAKESAKSSRPAAAPARSSGRGPTSKKLAF
jgi:hypothetical protein